jgi:putative membrane protein
MVGLTPDDKVLIAQAVGRAEVATSGEICCVLTEETSHYREIPIVWAALAALLLPPLALALGFRPLALGSLFADWVVSQSQTVERELLLALAAYAVAQTLLFAIVMLVVSIPAVRRVLTPAFVKRRRVQLSARHHFVSLVARHGPEGAYVMIFASRFDRMVEIVVSEAAHSASGDTIWHQAAVAMSDSMSNGRAAEGFVRAVDICGGELATRFPPIPGKKQNLLPDTLLET